MHMKTYTYTHIHINTYTYTHENIHTHSFVKLYHITLNNIKSSGTAVVRFERSCTELLGFNENITNDREKIIFDYFCYVTVTSHSH
jgi:hypothetical protein